MQEQKEKRNKELVDHIKKMRSEYEAVRVDEAQESSLFLDKLNRLTQLIFNDDSFSIYQNLNEQSIKDWQSKKLTRSIKTFFLSNFKFLHYYLLLITITLFLISEALSFYSIDGVLDTKTYVKAILTEACFIFLSGYRSNGWLQAAWVNVLRVSIFSLMLFVITSQTLDVGTRTISENDSIQKQVEFIESQITQKNEEIKYFREIGWPRNAARTTVEKEELSKKLIALKEQQALGKNQDVSKIEEYKMYGRAAFRVILLFISVLITRRLFTF